MISEKNIWRLTLVVFTLIVSFPLFSTEHIIGGHDYAFHLGRTEGIKESLAGGQFPVRMVGYWFSGYGEASGIFYPNLFFYIPAFLRFCGVPLMASYNILCIIINFIAVFLTYWSLSRLYRSRMTGAVGAMIYAGMLYRLIDIYSRSALGEALAMSFIPFTLITLWLAINRSTAYYICVVIGFTAIMQSHILSTLLTIVAMFLIIIYCHKKITIKPILKTATYITLLNLWFYLPFVEYFNKISFHMKTYSQNNLHAMSDAAFMLGDFKKLQGLCGYWILFIIALFILYQIYKRRFLCDKLFIVMLTISLIILFVETDHFCWKLIEQSHKLDRMFSILQFPYRFMMFGSLTLTLCVTSIFMYVYKRIRSKILIVTCCLALALSSLTFVYTFDKYTHLSHIDLSNQIKWQIKFLTYEYKQLSYLGYNDYIAPDISFEDLIYFSPEIYSDNEPPAQMMSVPKLIFNDIRPIRLVSNFQKVGTTIKFTANTDEPTTFTLPLFYYPYYKAYTADGTKLELSDSGHFHRMQVEVPAGVNEVTIKFHDKITWRVANWISFLTLCTLIIRIRRNKKMA